MIFDVIKKAKQLFYDNKNSGLDVNNVQDAIDDLTQAIVEVDAINEASGSPILLTDTIDDSLLDFKAYGRSTQRQWSGFDGELLSGAYGASDGKYTTNSNYVCSKNPMPCKEGESIKLTYGTSVVVMSLFFYDENMTYLNYKDANNTNGFVFNVPTNASYFHFRINENNATMTPQTAKNITVTVNGVKSYPNPEYPQAIESVADSGYFDGELLQGFYSGTGVFTSNSTYVCSRNPIPCNSGDTIKLAYGTTASEIAFIFYDKDMVFISRPYCANATEYETTTPTNAKYVHFYLREPNISITPTTVKKIVVTINDTYALKVKSKGKNLFDISGVPNTANMTNNQNGTLTITNSYSNNTYKKLSELTDLKIGQTYTLSFSSTSEHQFIYLSTTSEKWENGMSLKMTQNRLDSAVYFYGNTSGVTTISNIQIEENTVVTPYEPYKEEVKYSPLNEPLRSSLDGSVSDEVSLTDVTRRYAEVVFDGSDDEKWSIKENRPCINVPNIKKTNDTISMCTHFKNVPYGKNVSEFFNYITGDLYFIVEENLRNHTNWKTWLQANPITVQYELAEPITETIEPVDIVTYNNVTHLTASDNADMWVEYYSNSSVGQRLAKTDNKLAELDTVKELYNTPTVKARKCGKIIELTGSACTENELNQCLTALVNIGYAPDSITVLCMYNTGNSGDSSVGRLSMLGNYIVVSDMSNENFISNYNISFNAMWITG